MIFKNLLRHQEAILYRLERLYGTSLTYYSPTSIENDVETGAITKTYQTFEIRKAIVLPDRRVPKFEYDLSYVAANKNFVYGAIFDRSTRFVIVRAKHFPRYFKPAIRDHVIYNNARWDVGEVAQLEHIEGYIFRLNNMSSQDE